MLHSEKKILFEKFLEKWESKLEKMPELISLLTQYNDCVKMYPHVKPLSKERVWEMQLEWVSLVAQLENPIEKEFIKDYWVQLTADEYNFFIDLSNDSFPVFCCDYFGYEPYGYYKTYLAKDINEFMLNVDNPSFDIESHVEKMLEDSWEQFEEIYKKRDELGYRGKISLFPVNSYTYMAGKLKLKYSLSGDTLTVTEIFPMAIKLLPPEMEIFHYDLSFSETLNEENVSLVRHVKTFIYMLENADYTFSARYYKLYFDENHNSYAEYRPYLFTLKHSDPKVIQHAIDNIEEYLKLVEKEE